MNATKTFLLVDDDPLDAVLVENEFKQAAGRPWLLRTVGDGVYALQYLSGEGDYADRQKYPVPDVILLDLKMPRLNGFDVLDWLRHKSPQQQRLIPVVVLTSSAEATDVARAFTLGANAYVIKPVGFPRFQACIKGLLHFWGEHAHTLPPESA